MSYIDSVRNKVMLQRVKEDRNILQTIESGRLLPGVCTSCLKTVF